MKKIKLIIFSAILCFYSLSAFAAWPTKVQCDSVIRSFRSERALNGFVLEASDQYRWVDTAIFHQNQPPYKADNWYPVFLRAGDTLVAGHPGQSAYYTITEHFRSQKMNGKDVYWKLLQVKSNSTHGYRDSVAYYVVKVDSTIALLGKALNNTTFGSGGGWQFYIPDYRTHLRWIRYDNF